MILFCNYSPRRLISFLSKLVFFFSYGLFWVSLDSEFVFHSHRLSIHASPAILLKLDLFLCFLDLLIISYTHKYSDFSFLICTLMCCMLLLVLICLLFPTFQIRSVHKNCHHANKKTGLARFEDLRSIRGRKTGARILLLYFFSPSICMINPRGVLGARILSSTSCVSMYFSH